jgi:pyruvate/2-oxoglutarate dehydrogenase complex dihydrolipoamide dehydrogenase (E3) component
MPLGKRVVIIGGALQGCQLAEFLAKRGRKITIVDTAENMGEGLLTDDPWRLFRWFEQKGVVLFPGVKYQEINSEGLVISTKTGERKTLQADSIIIALPLKPDVELFNRLKGKVSEVYQIGDCRKPGYMYDAIADGSRIAREI